MSSSTSTSFMLLLVMLISALDYCHCLEAFDHLTSQKVSYIIKEEHERHTREAVPDTEIDGSASVPNKVSEWATPVRLNNSHLYLMAQWAGQGSSVLFVLGRDREMKVGATSQSFISNDYGSSFVEITHLFKLNDDKTNATIAKFYHHPKSNCHYVFTDTINQYLFTTTDCCQRIKRQKLERIHPSVIAFDDRRDNIFLIHDLESPDKKLYVTRNFGDTISHVQDYVKAFFLHYMDEEVTKLYVQRLSPSSTENNTVTTILSSNNFFERQVDTEILYRGASEFQIAGRFMFVTKESKSVRKHNSVDTTETRHLDLFISEHGQRFVQARFPWSEDKNLTHLDYHIINVTEQGQILLVVNHNRVLSNLYMSTRVTPYEVQFSLSLERVMYYNPNVTWHDSWLAATAGDKPFADVYKIQGLRGIYIASQIKHSLDEDSILPRQIQPEDLVSLITFNQGALWTPIKGPSTDEEGRNITDCWGPEGLKTRIHCSLHLSQQLSMKFPSSRSIPIMSSENAVGVVIGSGNMGINLKQRSNVFISADAGLSWHQVLKGSYYFNIGDHGGIIVAVKYYKTEGFTNTLLYSTNEGISWQSLVFYKEPIKVFGLLTEPGETTTTFTVFGTSAASVGVDWVIIKVDLGKVFNHNCTDDDYKRWSPADATIGKHRNCLLGHKEIYQRRMINSNCYNSREFQRIITVENCGCDRKDYQCDFGFKPDTSWSNGCIKDPEYSHDPYRPPAFCRPGQFYNLTRGYIKVRGDTCENGKAAIYEPQLVACPLPEEKEFLLVAQRKKIVRVNLRNVTDTQDMPLQGLKNVIALDYDLRDNCVIHGDIKLEKIFIQCLNGSAPRILVDDSLSVEGMSYDWISKSLYFVDGQKKTIELVRVDVEYEGRMRKTLLDGKTLDKPRGLVVHPIHGYLFYSDWGSNPNIGRANMDGSGHRILFSSPIVQWPNGLTLDYMANRLYWVDAQKDTISSCTYDGKDYKSVLSKVKQLTHPFAVAIHKDLMYWDDWHQKAIFMADKNSGKGITEILSGMSGAMDLKAFSLLHRQGNNSCSSNPCSHLCVPMPDNSYSCLCPDGMKAEKSGQLVSCKCPDGSTVFANGTCPKINGTCGPDYFSCNNGLCVPKLWVCDEDDDCGDGSDENEAVCFEGSCRPNQFQCENRQKCIPNDWRCDYDLDCSDGSDEKDCNTTACTQDQFQCRNGQCISLKWKCDLENDCQDGSDEESCVETQPICKVNEFQCPRSPQCLPKTWQCDGDFDCPGHEDEENCEPSKCKDFQFTCDNGHCIFLTWRCDGGRDCSDGSDEANCTAVSDDDDALLPFPEFPKGPSCNEWTFKCSNDQCIPYWWKCDGNNDCSDGSDEIGCENYTPEPDDSDNEGQPDSDEWIPENHSGTSACQTDKFTCPGTGECIWEAWLCDGEEDCEGGEDESEAVCKGRPVCTNQQFRCERSGQCVLYTQVCDGHIDCTDGSDEIGCASNLPDNNERRICSDGMFSCDDDVCFPASVMCDGKNDCIDSTDELGCVHNFPQVLGLEVQQDRVNSTSVRVDWWIPDMSNTRKLDFQPGYAPAGSDQWTYLAWQKCPDLTYTFSNLLPFTTYQFVINVRTENGAVYNGTNIVQATTSPDIPSAPTLIDVHQDGNSVVLRWTAPGRINGNLKHYQIEMSHIDYIAEWNTDGPETFYKIESKFTPTFTYIFRVRAVNSNFKGNYSKPVELLYAKSKLSDSVEQIDVVGVGNSWVALKWGKIESTDESMPEEKWGYRLSYKSVDNPIARYEDITFNNDNNPRESHLFVNVTGLSPSSNYVYSVNIQCGNLTGLSTIKIVKTNGRQLPRPDITNAQLSPYSGTAIKLTWDLPPDTKDDDNAVTWNYGVFYGTSQSDLINGGQRATTTDTSFTVSGLHSCESYSFVVAIVGPKGFGPPSAPHTKATKYSPGAPPKNLKARLDPSVNAITLTWSASCPNVDQAIGYQLSAKDLVSGKTTYLELAASTRSNFRHLWNSKVRYGTSYEIRVQTSTADSQSSEKVVINTVPIPMPEMLTTHIDVNSSSHVFMWQAPRNLPPYLKKDKEQMHYRLYLSTSANLTEAVQHYNTTLATFNLPTDKLEPGRIYFLGVSIQDKDGYESAKAGPIALDSPLPLKDIVVSPTGVAGVLIPILIVMIILGTALGYYVHRNRRLSRSFAEFASRYSPASGAAILNQAALDDDDDDSPIIRGFSDDEPLVVT